MAQHEFKVKRVIIGGNGKVGVLSVFADSEDEAIEKAKSHDKKVLISALGNVIANDLILKTQYSI